MVPPEATVTGLQVTATEETEGPDEGGSAPEPPETLPPQPAASIKKRVAAEADWVWCFKISLLEPQFHPDAPGWAEQLLPPQPGLSSNLRYRSPRPMAHKFGTVDPPRKLPVPRTPGALAAKFRAAAPESPWLLRRPARFQGKSRRSGATL